MTTRREFIGASAALLGASAAGANPAIEPASDSLDILFLGGTGFIGPHQVHYALARGHNVSVFNRGRKAGLFGGKVEELVGNRDAKVDTGLSALEGSKTWDVVIDNSGYVPRHVRDSAELLKDRCRRYIYTSSISVYDFEQQHSVDNNGPLYPAPEPATEEITGETYGPLKAECDRLVQEIFGDAATIVRPTYIVGPGDHTDRFTYWVERFQRGGEVLCPASPDHNVDWIDVRDLCHWLVRLGENDTTGVFNGTGPGQHVSRENFMWALRLSSPRKSNLHWPTRELMEETGFPTPMMGNGANSIFVDPSAAQAAGLTYRSLAETVRDTHEWWMSQSKERRAAPVNRAATDYRRWASAAEEAAVIAKIGS
jgi:2'-hydroxyisoflavone reductase